MIQSDTNKTIVFLLFFGRIPAISRKTPAFINNRFLKVQDSENYYIYYSNFLRILIG
jgi:hypothetical protein